MTEVTSGIGPTKRGFAAAKLKLTGICPAAAGMATGASFGIGPTSWSGAATIMAGMAAAASCGIGPINWSDFDAIWGSAGWSAPCSGTMIFGIGPTKSACAVRTKLSPACLPTSEDAVVSGRTSLSTGIRLDRIADISSARCETSAP